MNDGLTKMPAEEEASEGAGGAEASEGSLSPSETIALGGDPALVAPQPTGTLVGIAAVPEPRAESAPVEPDAGGSVTGGSADSLPRFDDNPLIAEFAPQRLRTVAAFEGFVPLGSPTRAFNDGIQQPITETALDVSGAGVGVERAAPPPRPLSWRMIGLAAGCFGLAGGVVIASQVLTSEDGASTEVSALTPSLVLEAREAPAAASVEEAPRPLEARPEPEPEAASQPLPSEAAEPLPSEAAEPLPSEAAEPLPGEAAEPLPGEASEPSLDDAELDALFALETRSEAHRCASAPGAALAPTSAPPSAPASWRAWRQAQQNGDVEDAHRLLCELSRSSPTDVRVYAELASLALRWGDAPGAEQAARAGLSLEREDAALEQLLGDALALLGNAAESRRLWLEPFGADVSTSERDALRLFEQRGKAALERADFARARTYYRRAVVISHGSARASSGLSQALLGLGDTRAAVAWARRATVVARGDAEAQMLYGDALYRAGDAALARRAWSDAAKLGRTPALRRRLSKGHP